MKNTNHLKAFQNVKGLLRLGLENQESSFGFKSSASSEKTELLLKPKEFEENAFGEGEVWGRSRRYLIKKKLGAGSMGMVFLAFDKKLNQEVALKILRIPKSTEDEKERAYQWFIREIKALKQLTHPYIIKIFESETYDYKGHEIPFYTMEYILGTSLEDFIHQNSSIRTGIQIIQKLATALSLAHQQKILHRDIKPSNIIIQKTTENPKLLDFGLARIFGATESFRPTWSNMLIGSPQFMAPEQFESPLNATYQSDIYSLGGILYFLLTKKFATSLPIDENPNYSLLKSTLYQQIQVDFSKEFHLDKELEGICLKALHKDLNKRYFYVEELSADLSHYLNQRDSWRHHFLKWKEECYSIKKICVLGMNTFGEIRPLKEEANEMPSLKIYAEILTIFEKKCVISIKLPLKINGKYYPSMSKDELFDGDQIEIEKTLFFYKKGSSENF